MSEAYANYQKSVAGAKKISLSDCMKIMFAKNQMKQTLVCVIFAIGLGWGNNLMTGFNNVFLTEMGFPIASVLLVGAIAGFGQPIGEMLSGLVSDKGGRTVPIFAFCGIAGVLCIAMGFIQSVEAYGVLQLIKTLFSSGAMAMLLTYIPESFPSSVRGSATGYIYGLQKFAVAFTAFLALACYNAGGWLGCMVTNGVIWFVAAFVILLFGRKTALTNIDADGIDGCLGIDCDEK